MRRLFLGGILACIALAASAQVTVPTANLPSGQKVVTTPTISVDLAGNYTGTPGGLVTGTSTTVAGTVTTANTFQSALVANSSRKGCLIVNTSANGLLVFLGAPGSATTGTSIPIAAGASFNCGSPQGLVVTDQVSLTSTVVSSSFVVVSQ